MKNEAQVIQNAFKPWKVYLAIFLGICIIAWMLYYNLSKPYFVFDAGHGTHEWVASNDTEFNPSDENQFVIAQDGNYRQQQLIDLISEMNWTAQSAFWIFIAGICMVGRDFFYILRIRILTKNALTWKQSFNVILLWEFASALSPGVVGGAAVAMFILKKEKIDLGRSTAIVFITALMDNLFFLLLVPLVILFLGDVGIFSNGLENKNHIKWIFWVAYLGVLFVSFLLFISIFIYPKFIQQLLQVVFKIPFLKKWKNGAMKTGDEIILTSAIMRKEKKSFWIKTIISTFFAWISRYLVINCLIAAFIYVSLPDHFIILGKQFLLWMIMLVSPTPGGSGVAEFAFGKIMMGMGASALLLTGIAALWRLISYFPYLIIGAILLPRWLQRKK